MLAIHLLYFTCVHLKINASFCVFLLLHWPTWHGNKSFFLLLLPLVKYGYSDRIYAWEGGIVHHLLDLQNVRRLTLKIHIMLAHTSWKNDQKLYLLCIAQYKNITCTCLHPLISTYFGSSNNLRRLEDVLWRLSCTILA